MNGAGHFEIGRALGTLEPPPNDLVRELATVIRTEHARSAKVPMLGERVVKCARQRTVPRRLRFELFFRSLLDSSSMQRLLVPAVLFIACES